MTALIVQPEAETDIAAAFHWYEARRIGLGRELVAEIDRTFTRIREAPHRPRVRHRGTRRVPLARYPYIVLYLLGDDTMFVLGVLHGRRNPRTFRSRATDFGGGFR